MLHTDLIGAKVASRRVLGRRGVIRAVLRCSDPVQLDTVQLVIQWTDGTLEQVQLADVNVVA